ncbi:hypothetical protein ADK86_19465 [Streptomyces sp. NRRL F-5755]|nr:hypothetical protein ADK86_19465 [Streptomyces sp. NRRL F-5755]
MLDGWAAGAADVSASRSWPPRATAARTRHRLLLKMVQRIHQAGRADGWPQGDCLPARVVFGPHFSGCGGG